MEGGDLYGAFNSSLKRNGSRWDKAVEVFCGSSHEENDEETLQWDTMERQPTYQLAKEGIITKPEGGPSGVDIDHLGLQQMEDLSERVIQVTGQDNERFLMDLKNRIERVKIALPTIEVRFEHLNIETEAQIGSRALPTESLNFLGILPNRKKQINILKDLSGVIKPGRMTLILGSPSSGKTTLLLALAGKLDSKLKVSGKVTYNGYELTEFVPKRIAAYISQHDLHLEEMTVRETLEFAARCQGTGHRYKVLTELVKREQQLNIEPHPDIVEFLKEATATGGKEASGIINYFLKILGLEDCADIMVGNISGGQKKRVTIGEMLVGPSKVLFMDEISTGLDSSTTFQIVNWIKQANHIFNRTAVISLVQPAPEIYDLFDDIILLSEGLIVYQGPRRDVPEFFEEHMGFKCPERKGIADFLQEVTSRKDQGQYWARKGQPYSFVTAKQFAGAFQLFRVGMQIGNELSTPFDKAKSHPAALATEKFGTRKWELLKACFSREILLMKRNSFVYTFKLTLIAIVAIITMTLFLRTEMHRTSVTDGGIFAGALFYSTNFITLIGMAEISLTIAKLPVFYKHRDLLFFPSWAYLVPQMILKVPIILLEVALWVFITYYVIGYDPNVGRLFKQYLLFALVSQMASGLFQFIAATGRTMIVANTFGSLALTMLSARGGFVLAQDKIEKWWIWGYWISPLMYGQNAVAVNEFTASSWSHITPNSTLSLGVQVLKSRGLSTDPNWYWIGVGALAGFVLLFNFCYTLALAFLNPFQKPQAVISEDTESEELGANTEAIRQSNQISHHQTQTGSANHQNKRGMILPFEPHSITFNGIKYSVDMPQEMKHQGVDEDRLVLLNNVSGAFRPGVLAALMGVRDAGTTTLMDVLAGRNTIGYIEGDIKVSGYPKKQETFARIAGYCEQNDIHSPHVTVYESLTFSAWLRLPREVSSKTREFVEEVMELVGLTSLRQALVGVPGVSGLSTEQRRQLTIAVELVANPSIIFMDEPTSGLDARAAAIVMRTVRNIVDTGRTVICTIHQPSIDIFEAFDELFLMKQGGQEIYVGPLGRHSAHLIEYFEGIQGVPKIKDGYNPATWMLEVTTPAQEKASGVNFVDAYKNSELYRRNNALILELSKPTPDSKEPHFSTRYSQSFLTQGMACLWKQSLSYWRNPQYTAVGLLYTVTIALLFGTMFWNLGSKAVKRQDLFNVIYPMYASVLSLGIQKASSVQPVVAEERTVFYREKAAGMYSPLPYAFARAFIELPYVSFQSMFYCIIVYLMMGFEQNTAKFFWYLFVMYFTLLYFTFYGMMVAAVIPNQQIASVISSTFYSLWNLFSGFIIPQPRMPVWWRWYSWLCPVSWTMYGMVVSQFGDVENTLDTGQMVQSFLTSYFGFKHDFLIVVAAIVFAFAALFVITFAISIRLFNFQRR